jgi:hypothetical protein
LNPGQSCADKGKKTKGYRSVLPQSEFQSPFRINAHSGRIIDSFHAMIAVSG